MKELGIGLGKKEKKLLHFSFSVLKKKTLYALKVLLIAVSIYLFHKVSEPLNRHAALLQIYILFQF